MSDEAKDFFFIDANRAYRGPVTRETLALLLQTQAITPSTYVYADGLAECNGSWVRLKRLPKLLEELQQAASQPAASECAPVPAPSPAAAAAAEALPRAASSAAPPAAAADGVPRQRMNPTTDAGASRPACAGSSSVTMPAASQVTAAPAVADARLPAQPSDRVSHVAHAPPARERLFGYFPASAPAAAPTRRPSTGHAGPFRLFGSRSKAPKSTFGQPLHACTLDADGVPEVLSKLRAMLFAQGGHLTEGIFRVSPSSSVLKAARQDAESNRLEKIRDAESIAQLIKLWFRKHAHAPPAH